MVLLSSQGVGQGCYEGIGGLVTSPIAGAEEGGIVGCVQGAGHGLVGVVTKPLSGIFACMSKTAGGVGTGIRNIGDDVIRAPLVRVRPPRNFGREEGVQVSRRHAFAGRSSERSAQFKRFFVGQNAASLLINPYALLAALVNRRRNSASAISSVFPIIEAPAYNNSVAICGFVYLSAC